MRIVPEEERCGKCGGEKDSEGWCANYCTDDDGSEEQSSSVAIEAPADPANDGEESR